MSFTHDVPVRCLDLSVDPSKMWSDVIEEDREAAKALANAGWEEAETKVGKKLERLRLLTLTKPGLFLASRLFAALYRVAGRHVDEMKAWADGIGVDEAKIITLQCMYSLSHFGCTAGITHDEKLGRIHVRTLDWGESCVRNAIGNATRVFHCKRSDGETVVLVGMAGFVGALSGMLPGKFSATINWAPRASLLTPFLGPVFKLREVLETANTYDQAVKQLREARLSTSVFFTVCGSGLGEGCVIESARTGFFGKSLDIRKLGEDVDILVQTNHYRDKLKAYNTSPNDERSALEESSCERATAMEKRLRGLHGEAHTLDEIRHDCMDETPVANDQTTQKMIFRLDKSGQLGNCGTHPSGSLGVWRWQE